MPHKLMIKFPIICFEEPLSILVCSDCGKRISRFSQACEKCGEFACGYGTKNEVVVVTYDELIKRKECLEKIIHDYIFDACNYPNGVPTATKEGHEAFWSARKDFVKVRACLDTAGKAILDNWMVKK